MYRIGKIAKTFRISKEALRYYERNGIVIPSREAENAYRYYSQSDIQRIATIKKMQNMRFTLEEIRAVFEGMTTNEYLIRYDAKIDELEKQIYFQQQIVERMKWQSHMIKYEDVNIFEFTIRKKAAFGRIDFGSFDQLLSNEAVNRVTSDWFRYMAIVNASTRIDGESAMRGEIIESKGLMVPEETIGKMDLMNNNLVEHLDFKDYVYGIIRIETGENQHPFEKSVSQVMDFIRESKLQCTTDLYTNVIASFSDKEGRHIVYSEIYMGVQ